MTSKTLGTQETHGEKKFGRELRKDFLFDEKHTNLNHGSFGTYPRPVQTAMRAFQDEGEARPDDFILYQFPKYLDKSRAAISKVLNAPDETVVFVPNATTGVNIVLRNLVFKPGEKILYLDTVYGAVEKTVAYITETTPAEGVKIEYTFPVEDDWLVEELKKTVKKEEESGNKVKVAIFDTVVSMPGVRLPFERLVKTCRELGVMSCLDAAHGVGHVELDLTSLDPDFFVSNCHKWLFAPRGCAVLYVPHRNQPLIRSTLPTSHGFTPIPTSGGKISNPIPSEGVKSVWITNFDFVGTIDNAPYLCIPTAIKYRESLGGEKAIISYCQGLAKQAGLRAAEILGTEIMDNSTETMTKCCLVNVRLPLQFAEVEGFAEKAGVKKEDLGMKVRMWMSRLFIDEFGTFIMVFFYKGNWYARFSGQVYLELKDFEWGAKVLLEVCERARKGEFVGVASKL